MTTRPRDQEALNRRDRWQTLGLASIAGALALLLLLIVALLLPEGTIVALTGQAAAAANAKAAALVLDDPTVVTPTITTTTGVDASPEITVDQLPAVAECTGCMHIWIIDRYERKGVGGGWRMTITYPDGTNKTFRVPAGGELYVPAWSPPPGICPGPYQIALEVPAGWEPITPASVPVTLTGKEGQDKCAQVRFKVGLLPTLKVVKLDETGPGGRPAGIPDWSMTVTDNSGVTMEGSTDGLGEVYFSLPHLGEWLVTEESKIGWQPANPAVPFQLIQISAPTQATATPWIVEVTFVNKQIRDGCIEVLKTDSAGELLNGWTMTVRRDDGTQQERVGQTGSDGNGRVVICGLPMGGYTVTETPQAWYRANGAIGPSQPVTLTTPGTTVSVAFVNEPLGCIDGYKIDYLNRGLGEWEIIATNGLTGDRYATSTDVLGYFYFPDLPFGPYTIEESVRERWSAVTASTQQVSVMKRGPECVPVRFKNVRDSACLEVYKGDASDENAASPIGYSGIAGVPITLRPAYGGTAIEVATDGTGRAFFDSLTPGMYVVEEAISDPWVAVADAKVGPFELGASEPCWPLNSTGPVVFLNRQKTMAKETVAPPKSTAPASSKSSGCRAWHTVRPGNTLYSLARWYGSSVNGLMKANHICNPNLIYIGQKLCIP